MIKKIFFLIKLKVNKKGKIARKFPSLIPLRTYYFFKAKISLANPCKTSLDKPSTNFSEPAHS